MREGGLKDNNALLTWRAVLRAVYGPSAVPGSTICMGSPQLVPRMHLRWAAAPLGSAPLPNGNAQLNIPTESSPPCPLLPAQATGNFKGLGLKLEREPEQAGPRSSASQQGQHKACPAPAQAVDGDIACLVKMFEDEDAELLQVRAEARCPKSEARN